MTQTVASSYVCTSPLAVKTVVGLFDVVTVSNSEFKSFLEHGGCADEDHLGKYIRAKDFGLEFWCDVQ